MIELEQGQGDVIFDVKIDEKTTQQILWADIIKLWPNAKGAQIAGIGALVQEPIVLFWMTSGNGLDGIIAAWDTEEEKIIHISEGSFTRRALVYGNMVFSLREVPKPDLSEMFLCGTVFGTMDAVGKDKVNAISLNIKVFDKQFNSENYKLSAKDSSIFAGFRNEIRKVDLVKQKNPDEDKSLS